MQDRKLIMIKKISPQGPHKALLLRGPIGRLQSFTNFSFLLFFFTLFNYKILFIAWLESFCHHFFFFNTEAINIVLFCFDSFLKNSVTVFFPKFGTLTNKKKVGIKVNTFSSAELFLCWGGLTEERNWDNRCVPNSICETIKFRTTQKLWNNV